MDEVTGQEGRLAQPGGCSGEGPDRGPHPRRYDSGMDDEPTRDETSEARRPAAGLTIGAAMAIGVGVGTALFAATSTPVWIALGAGLGLAIGAALQSRSK